MLSDRLDTLRAERYETSFGEMLNYRLHVPADKASDGRFPLILFLHGAGERGDDNVSHLAYGVDAILEHSIRTGTPALLLAPQCPSEMRWSNVLGRSTLHHTLPEFPSYPMKLVSELLEVVLETYPVDLDRVYVTGLSMGGFGTWDLLMRRSDHFAAALPICGGADETKAHWICHIPQWVFHGSDDPVISPERSRRMVNALKEAGCKVRYTEYAGVDHNAWDRTYANSEVLEWLLAQKRASQVG